MRLLANICKGLAIGVTPLSVIVGFYLTLFTKGWGLVKLILVLWCLGEVGFFMYWRWRMRIPFRRKPCAMSFEERAQVCRRLMDNVDDMYDMLTRWLVEQPTAKLHLESFREWIVWMLFDKEEGALTSDEEGQLNKLMPLIGQSFQHHIPHSLQKRIVSMRPSIDTMPKQPKPLLGHLLIKTIHELGFWKLRSFGFRRNTELGLSYWHLWGDSQEPPIVYIHGIGIGFFFYLAKLKEMSECHKRREVVLLELPHISMDIASTILDHDQTLTAIDAIFKRHRFKKVSLVAHSYGTVLASWVMRTRPHYLCRLTLVDPVCFCVWDSTLARNFLYAKPLSFIHDLTLFFVARDPLINHTVSRELYWYESVLYPEDIVVPATIFLSTFDWVVDATRCYRYLNQRLPTHCKLELMETFHGGCLAKRSYYTKIFRVI
ncbi:hypothetical protein L0F63_004358 [Massospora cicadina]|nr:hypothetical protein L0F63_004358 [Massospora cicadina]